MQQNLEEKISPLAPSLFPPSQALKNIPDKVCYIQHPAYSDFVQSAGWKNKIISLIIFTKYFFIVCIKRMISYELIPAHIRKPNSPSNFLRFLKSILINNYYKLFYKNKMTLGLKETPIFEALDTQGICVVDLNSHQFDIINQFAAPLIEHLRALRNQTSKDSREFSESRITVLCPNHGDLFRAIESSLTE